MEIDKVDFYFKVLARYDQYVQLANTKASNHITLLASMLAATTALVGWGGTFETPTFPTAIIVFLYIIFLYNCYEWYNSCMKVIEPNRTRNLDNSEHKNEEELSCIFYSDVSKFSDFENFKDQALKRSDDEYLADLIHQVSNMARVTEKKFNDCEGVNSYVKSAVLISIVILFFSVVNKIGG